MRRKGLSRTQIICIVLLWALLCVMLFTTSSDKSMAEKIIYSIISGILIYVGVVAGQNKMNKRRRQ